MADISNYNLHLDTPDGDQRYIPATDCQVCDEQDVRRKVSDIRGWLKRGVMPIVTVFVPEDAWDAAHGLKQIHIGKSP